MKRKEEIDKAKLLLLDSKKVNKTKKTDIQLLNKVSKLLTKKEGY